MRFETWSSSGSVSARPNVLSVSLKVPYPGIDNAGGSLLIDHFGALQSAFSVRVWAPGSRDNIVALESGPTSIDQAWLVPAGVLRRSLPGKVVALIFREMVLVPDIFFFLRSIFSPTFYSEVRRAQVVELQWVEYIAFAPFIRLVNRRARVFCVIHDVRSQSIERRERGDRRLRAAVSRLQARLIRLQERLSLRYVSGVIVLSEKDAGLIRSQSSTTRVVVLDPPLVSEVAERYVSESQSQGRTAFGMFGAFHRIENEDGAIWLLEQVWESVVSAIPDATLWLVGAGPSPRLLRAAGDYPGSVQVTGFVESMEDYYDIVDHVVIPLRRGAGVKFKTIDAVIRKKNIVTTDVGIEGVADPGCFYSVTSDSRVFADKMISLGLGLDAAHEEECRLRAAEVVKGRYTRSVYEQTLLDLYESDVP